MGFETRIFMFKVIVRAIDVKFIQIILEEFRHVPSV